MEPEIFQTPGVVCNESCPQQTTTRRSHRRDTDRPFATRHRLVSGDRESLKLPNVRGKRQHVGRVIANFKKITLNEIMTWQKRLWSIEVVVC